jgi:uncharacterized protein (DUF2249 family)
MVNTPDMKSKVVTLDLREHIREGRDPFSRIMQVIGTLETNQSLRLIAPFEPRPLYGVLASQGFSHSSRTIESGDWEVTFARAV